jgi:hypothetical protein
MGDLLERLTPCPQCKIHRGLGFIPATTGENAPSYCNLCNGSGEIPISLALEYGGLNVPQVIVYAIVSAGIFLTSLI